MSQNSPTPLSGRISESCWAVLPALDSAAGSASSPAGDGREIANSMPPPSSPSASGGKVIRVGREGTSVARFSERAALPFPLAESAGLRGLSANQLP